MAHNSHHRRLLFPVGALTLSQGVDRLMREGDLDPIPFFQRHARGDWGNLDEHNRQRNQAALAPCKDRLISSYQITPDLTLWIITDSRRAITTVLLGSEYSSNLD